MDIKSLFHSVSRAFDSDTRSNQNVDTDGMLGKLSGIFRQHGYEGDNYQPPQTGGYGGQDILPASQDPMGDPADREEGGILPASQDPLGDPADEPRR